jgi:hypothetical protein
MNKAIIDLLSDSEIPIKKIFDYHILDNYLNM